MIPGVIDSNTKNTIKVMVKPLSKTIQLHKGQRIAQLLLIPYIHLPNPVLQEGRGQGQFGSSKGTFMIQDLSQRPFKVIKLEGKPFKGLMDTGADRTCICVSDWPNTWPIKKTDSSLLGLGSASGVIQSAKCLQWELKEKRGLIQPYVLPSLPFTLWGRDLLDSIDIRLVSAEKLRYQHFS